MIPDKVFFIKLKGRRAVILLLFWALVSNGAVRGLESADTTALRISKEAGLAGNDSLRIRKLFDLAFHYFDRMGDARKADSVSKVAVMMAEGSHRPALIQLACDRYIRSNDLSVYYLDALGYALRAEQVSGTGNNDTYFTNTLNLAEVHLAGYQYDKALDATYRALSIATLTENEAWKARSYLAVGQCLEGKNQKIEAFRNYLNAAGLADRLKDPALKAICFSRLSHFYNLNRLYNKATHYKLLQEDLVRRSVPVDSVALMWVRYDLQVIDLNSNNNRLNEESMREILDFARRYDLRRLLRYEIALIRSHMVGAERIDLLYDLYHNQFPDELARLSTENPGLYFRLRAYFCEKKRKPDSALFFFNQAEKVIAEDPNKIMQSNFYNRLGQYFLRQQQPAKAIEKFTRSFELAEEASYFDYMLSASDQLEKLSASMGDFRNAYRYAGLTRVLSDSLANLSKQDQMLVMEIDHETRQREHAAELEQQSVARRHYLQYTAIIIIIIGVFILLLMLGSLKVPEWIIRMLGFFSFIFLFEFIILLADHKIHDLTHGEPWKILLIKIFLIAILLPFHHWIEKRVVAFLLGPGMINITRLPIKSRLRERIRKLRKEIPPTG
jgi:tetratricopeptide (TPR) repeat protein